MEILLKTKIAKNMKNTLILLLLFVVSSYEVSAQFKQENGMLKASITEIRSGKINGIISIREIFYPDKSFDCLEPLGKPTKIDEQVSGAGDQYIFYYPGLTIAFHNTNSEQKMTLSYLEMDDEQSFLSLEQGQTIKTNTSINALTNGKYQSKNKNGESEVLVPFYNAEGSKMILKEKNQKINSITIWF